MPMGATFITTSIIFMMTAPPSITSFSMVGTVLPRAATHRPKRAAKTIRGSRCSRESSSGKSFTLKADASDSPMFRLS